MGLIKGERGQSDAMIREHASRHEDGHKLTKYARFTCPLTDWHGLLSSWASSKITIIGPIKFWMRVILGSGRTTRPGTAGHGWLGAWGMPVPWWQINWLGWTRLALTASWLTTTMSCTIYGHQHHRGGDDHKDAWFICLSTRASQPVRPPPPTDWPTINSRIT